MRLLIGEYFQDKLLSFSLSLFLSRTSAHLFSTKWLEMTHPASHGRVRMYRVPSKAAFLRRLFFAKARWRQTEIE